MGDKNLKKKDSTITYIGKKKYVALFLDNSRARPDFLRQKILEEFTKIQHLANCGGRGQLLEMGLAHAH